MLKERNIMKDRKHIRLKEHKIEFDALCTSCNGSGLYVGMAEKDGMAVTCSSCKGTGAVHRVIKWTDPPRQLITRDDVRWVIECSPGIFTGITDEYPLGAFGGMSYEDWKAGTPFTQGMEMRKFACPAIWYQAADYKKKPKWDECHCGFFKDCPHFKIMALCWERYDEEEGLVRRPRS